MTPNDDGGFELTREEYVNLMELRRDVKHILLAMRKLPCMQHASEIANIRGRLFVFGLLVPVLSGLVGVFIGKFI